ncbi:BREX-2 system adenine-specific DNA-methyltransferase PglX [Streptomonospora wellingtoniae]|uniref:site-specific DNA-methyltransferase (adenine-specific) n=1 Tax=Streptomonospora wellingtoniae TaxID=3075544 RepID=A0ABU2KYZ9_9ACTN|nr:BREX-2 system adenine-specific DNA-methyltransferase PglX [Streptomonospora sp. DSM 45055]MDT0304253.1 BREX-2 system adenine-specific DNA-methyltransferase PglX [Streptomonospora sp. DSM 45055]
MVDHASLLKDLQKQVKLLEQDLRERSEDPTAIKGIGEDGQEEFFEDALRREHTRAFEAERTAATYETWRDERVTQAAASWVLATVFVRFCEDNGLLEHPYISGPRDERNRYDIAQELKDAWVLEWREKEPDSPERTDRDWLVHTFEEMSVSSITAGLFDRNHNPMWTITPSHQAAKALIDFWREVGDDGHLVHDFTDETWDTRFLGDLYQDLSESARKNFALLQTPEFVEEFILDYTLEPAVKEFGLDGNRIYQAESKGFRMIDPTCGSGHFLLGAFHRLLNKWREAEPGVSEWDLISRSLRSIHGVDKNPFAVAIARFRLLVAAMKEGGIHQLTESNPEWPIVVAAGDSLLHGRGAPGRKGEVTTPDRVHRYTTEDVPDYINKHDLLGVNSYHVVVGNPPYITVKDKKENDNYRSRYSSCSGTYALSVPFAERFFNLAKRAGGDKVGAGHVGQITANSFMKREFGKKLIEKFFRNEVRLTHVIDTSGAYIPGHGTPTVILVGRNMLNSHKASVRAVLGIRGEPQQPQHAAEGLVWRAITSQLHQPGSESEWVTVTEFPWKSFISHPWSLSGGGSGELFSTIEGTDTLKSKVRIIGRTAHTGSDESYFAPVKTWHRYQAPPEKIKPLVEGETVRDWSIAPNTETVFPYGNNLQPELADDFTSRHLWKFRSLLKTRREPGGTHEEIGLTWYEWSRWHPERFNIPLGIGMSFVATHNHFVLDRGEKVFNRSAPVIKLPKSATKDQHLEILGVLNSSAACFWMKQVSHDKGSQSGTGGFMHDEWERFYEFTGTKIQNFPLPMSFPLDLSKEIDSGAQHLSRLEPSAVSEKSTPTRDRLNETRDEHIATRRRMIALQEEIDWDVYHRYGLISDEEHAEVVLSSSATVPEVELGERAFEILLARNVQAGETTTVWFTRHHSTPITTLPSHWPEEYRKVVEKRIELITSRKDIGLIERPEYKRRWQSEPWEKKQKAALKSWLLDKCEDRRFWFQTDGFGEERPRTLSLRALANRVRDEYPEAADVASIYDPDKDFSAVIAEVVQTEHVPHLAALRYKETGMDKRRQWEYVWDKQREEDALNADLPEGEPEKRLNIPVPPKYTSGDFRKPTYWSNRGKLDVPKERFISYPGAEDDEDGTLVLGWAGWDHAQQADALGTLAHSRINEHGWADDRERMTPLLAGIAELMPWVRQWHIERDEYGETPADLAAEDLSTLQNATGITASDMADWRPSPAKRGRKGTSSGA